jgi:AraC-like DNA-binding protein
VAGSLLDGPVGEAVLAGGAAPLAVALSHLAPDGLDPQLGSALEARAADAAEARDPQALADALDESWAPLLARAAPLDPVVMDAVFRILRSGGAEPAADVARRVGLSPRQMRRRFRPRVGLAIKELARIQRARAAAVGLVAGDHGREARWVDLAVAHGYADQAHLVREVRRLTGTTPTRWARHLGRIEHGQLLR